MANKASNQVLINYVNKMLDQKRGPGYIERKLIDYFFCSEAMAREAVYQAKAERIHKKINSGGNVPRGTNCDCDCGSGCMDNNGCNCKDEQDTKGYVGKDGKWVAGDWKDEESEEDTAKRHNSEGGVMFLKSELAQANRTINSLKKTYGRNEDLIEKLCNAIETVKPLPKVVYKKNNDSKEVTVVSLLGDWHYGENINERSVEGFNSFSVDIAVQRVNTYMAKLLDWVKLHRNNYTVKEWVVLVLGDTISGSIHQELLETNAMPCSLQSIGAGNLLADAIKQGAPHFEKVRIECVTSDNHGRLSKKPISKRSGMDNWSYVVGYVAKQALRDHKNVEFNLHDMYETVVKIQNKKYLITHGDGIPCAGQIPFAGIQNKISREAVARMHMDDSVKFDSMVLGHFHQPAMMPNWIMNGSLSATSEYDHKAARHCPACQVAFFVHPVWGEFDYTPFWL